MRRRLIPDPTRSDVDHDRFYHLDLDEMDDDDVWAERHVLAHRLAQIVFRRVHEPSSVWIRERLVRLGAEQRRRRRRAA
jgi:hypothetical protein